MAAAALDIPAHLLADPIAPEIVWEKGSLGSPVLVLKGGHPEVLKAMTAGLRQAVQKRLARSRARTCRVYGAIHEP